MSTTVREDAPPALPGSKGDCAAHVTGRLSSRVLGGRRRVLYVLFGLVYVQQLVRLVGWLFGLRTEVELALSNTAIRVHTCTRLLGLPTHEGDALYPLVGIRRAGLERVAGAAFLWAGGGLFVAAVALATVLGFRGHVGFGGSLVLAAVAFLTLGLALDLGAYALVQRFACRSRVRLSIELSDGRRLVVAGVAQAEAHQFLDELGARLPRPRRP